MEYFLLIIVILLLVDSKVKMQSKFNILNLRFKEVSDKLDKVLQNSRITAKEPTKEPIKKVEKAVIKEAPLIIQKPVKAPQKIEFEASVKPVIPKPTTKAPEKVAKKEVPVVASRTPVYSVPKKERSLDNRSYFQKTWEGFKTKNPDLEKFVGENLINKLGILILVLGISYFVKFAIDKNWINEPARVGIGVLAGTLVLFLAHKLRAKYSSFSSVLVSGAIAVFYFTIAIAFHEYTLFSQEIAFSIMVLITAFSCLISLSYNRIELAILSLIGGFSVPFMIQSGSGNYVVLFVYIAILNIGILALAYFKKWNLVNKIAFIFTTILFVGWLFKDINTEAPHYLGALIFAFVFYVLFVVINIINNIRNKGVFSKVELMILVSNTFVFYGVGIVILTPYQPQLTGLFTAIIAVFNLLYAWLLFKKFGLDKTTVYLFIGLTLTFITLAIPVQFSGHSITLFWSVEAVLLMWLAQKSQIKEYRFIAVFVQGLMLVSLVMDWPTLYVYDAQLYIIANPVFISGISVILSLLAVRYLLRNETALLLKYKLVFNPKQYRKIALVIAVVLSYMIGFLEVRYQSKIYLNAPVVNAVISLYHLLFSAVFCFFLYREKTTFSNKLLSGVSAFNIIFFILLFSMIPFAEFKENLLSDEINNDAFYLHYVSLLVVVSCFYFIYKTNKFEKAFQFFNHRVAKWIAAFCIVFILSNELLLHGLKTMNAGLITNISSQFNEINIDLYQKENIVKDVVSFAKIKIVKTSFPVLWGILAFLFLIIGIKKQWKEIRIIALALLGITIVKLFAYDINNVSESGKIVAFILLGVLILIISFVYQKLKILVIDDEKKSKDDAEN